jgi:hypothetical protein
MPSYPGFLGPANRGQSYMADDEICDNWYLERNESPNAPQPWCMLPCPGVELRAEVQEAPIRGQFYQRGRAFFVAGFAFYELLYDGTTWSTTLRGTVESDENPVTINANGDAGDQLWITSGGVGYIYDLTSDTLSDEGNSGTVVSMGGFASARFLYLDATTGAFYASAQYDGTSWDPSFVAQSQSGDPWRALVVTPDHLIRLLGESSGEAWADQGSQPFPFSQIANANIEYGIVAPFAWSVDTAISWVAANKQGRGIVVRAPGYGPERISTHAIETSIQGYPTDLSDTIAFAYQENGHAFSVFQFPTADQTWVFDQASGLWHSRSYWDTVTATKKSWRFGCMMEAFGKVLVGDRFSGSIYELKSSYYADVDGVAIRRVRQPPRLSMDQRLMTVDSLELVMDKGVGLATGQGDDPRIIWQMSRDGGKTFPVERTARVGAMGEWNTRVRWLRCGQARNRVDRFIATDPVPFRISDCIMTVRVGEH